MSCVALRYVEWSTKDREPDKGLVVLVLGCACDLDLHRYLSLFIYRTHGALPTLPLLCPARARIAIIKGIGVLYSPLWGHIIRSITNG